MDQHVVPADLVPQSFSQPANRPFESIVLEGADGAARVAEHVVMVFAARDHGLVARTASTDLHSLHEPDPMQ